MLKYTLIMMMVSISSATWERKNDDRKEMYTVQRYNEKYNLEGYTSYASYISEIESIFTKKLVETFNFYLNYSKIYPATLLSKSSPEKLVFLQLLHSMKMRNSNFNNILFLVGEIYPIKEPLQLKNWMMNHFDFPPELIYNITHYIASKEIAIPKPYIEQLLFLTETHKIIEIAAEEGDKDTVKWLLRNNYNLPSGTHNYFENAWKNGRLDIVTLLMGSTNLDDLNINKEIVNKMYNNNETLLHFAVRYGSIKFVEYLLKNLDENKGSRDIFGRSPLYIAVELNKSDLVELLIRQGGNKHKEELLNLAVMNGNLKTVEVLVKLNEVNDLKDDTNNNPWLLAVKRNNADLLNILASSSLGRDKINLTNNFGDTLMHIASAKGYLQSIIMLLKLGATYDSRNNYGQTPLYKAVENESYDVMEKLIAAGADIDTRTDLGDTLMHLVVSNGNLKIAKLLLRSHIKIQKNFLGNEPMYLAAHLGNTDMVNLLINYEENIVTLNNGQSLLHKAASEGNENAIIKLIEFEFIDINAKDDYGITPLHLAAGHGHFKAVRILLINRANVNAKTVDLWTPMHRAAFGGYKLIVELLLRFLADPYLENKDGDTPLQLAIDYKHENVAQLLSDYFITIR